MIVPPLGLGTALPLVPLLLAFACVLGLMIIGRAALRGRGRRRLIMPAMFCLLALALMLGAREMWSLSW